MLLVFILRRIERFVDSESFLLKYRIARHAWVRIILLMRLKSDLRPTLAWTLLHSVLFSQMALNDCVDSYHSSLIYWCKHDNRLWGCHGYSTLCRC